MNADGCPDPNIREGDTRVGYTMISLGAARQWEYMTISLSNVWAGIVVESQVFLVWLEL